MTGHVDSLTRRTSGICKHSQDPLAAGHVKEAGDLREAEQPTTGEESTEADSSRVEGSYQMLTSLARSQLVKLFSCLVCQEKNTCN